MKYLVNGLPARHRWVPGRLRQRPDQITAQILTEIYGEEDWSTTIRKVEEDEGAVEAIEATGASRLQVLWIGILPQVLPVIYGTIVYRWDINIRESTVLGFVGAGGIGILLYASINQFLWREVAVMLIAVLAVVVVSEFVSAGVRQRIT